MTIDFGDTTQVFNVGVASCGVPGRAERARRRRGAVRVDAARRPRRARRRPRPRRRRGQPAAGLPVRAARADPRAGAGRRRRLRAGGRGCWASAASSASPSSPRRSSDSAPMARTPSTAATSRPRSRRRSRAREAPSGCADLAGYETAVREPVAAEFAGCEILTNPPPSSGGILIAYALELLTRIGATDPASVVSVMERAQEARTPEFLAGLYEPGFSRRFLADRLGLDHPHHGPRRRRRLRQRHLLQRLRLRRVRRRHRDPAQQHARRGGSEPAWASTRPSRAGGCPR